MSVERRAFEVHRVVLDTNVVISGTIIAKGAPFIILESCRKREFCLITSEDQIEEIRITLQRPKFSHRYGVTPEIIQALERRLQHDAIVVQPQLPYPITVRDEDDKIILAAAFAGSAAIIVTGDQDLLSLDGNPQLGGLRIQDPTTFATSLIL